MKQMLLILFFFFISTTIFSQESISIKEIRLNISHSKYQINIIEGNASNYSKTGNYQLAANVKIFSFLETGIYGGYSKYFTSNQLINYGLLVNIHIIPLLFESKFHLLEPYITGKLGSTYYINDYNNYSISEYNIGAGVRINPLKKLGFFTEYCWGKYFFENDQNFKIGLTVKIK